MWKTEGEHGLKQAGEPQRTMSSAGEDQTNRGKDRRTRQRVSGLRFPGEAPRTHLLQLQLNDLLLEGVGFVLSFHVGFFYAVLLGTEIQGRQVSSFKTATRLLSLVTATTPSQQTLIFVFLCLCVCAHACVYVFTCAVCVEARS